MIDPKLNFTEKIKYPYYGSNGVLLSLDNFKKDFQKIDFNQLTQPQVNIDNFKIDLVIKQWEKLLINSFK